MRWVRCAQTCFCYYFFERLKVNIQFSAFILYRYNGTQTGTTTLGQRGPESNSNEGVLQIPLTPKLEPHHQI